MLLIRRKFGYDIIVECIFSVVLLNKKIYILIIPYGIISNTMLTKTQLKIIAYLINNKNKLLGIRELAKEISCVYYLVQRNIHQLKEKNIINIQKAGKTNLIILNREVDYLYLVEAEKFKRDLFYKKYPSLKIMLKKIIKQSKSSFFILIVFGSYAKEQVRKDSDLDLLVIVPNQKQAEIIEKVISSIARISPIKIHETIITEKSFALMSQKKELNVVLEAKDKHILIYGNELYYKLA